MFNHIGIISHDRLQSHKSLHTLDQDITPRYARHFPDQFLNSMIELFIHIALLYSDTGVQIQIANN